MAWALVATSLSSRRRLPRLTISSRVESSASVTSLSWRCWSSVWAAGNTCSALLVPRYICSARATRARRAWSRSAVALAVSVPALAIALSWARRCSASEARNCWSLASNADARAIESAARDRVAGTSTSGSNPPAAARVEPSRLGGGVGIVSGVVTGGVVTEGVVTGGVVGGGVVSGGGGVVSGGVVVVVSGGPGSAGSTCPGTPPWTAAPAGAPIGPAASAMDPSAVTSSAAIARGARPAVLCPCLPCPNAQPSYGAARARGVSCGMAATPRGDGRQEYYCQWLHWCRHGALRR